ncbi:MAG: LapA family protein [Deltaproteobacteria bacterium]|nr:LapA family protein [Deltaproteobacteria bacterium]MBI4374719.1 LapA family protein [Deltaproteobacteria bacterium]
MKKIIYAAGIALGCFIVLNSIYSNVGGVDFSYPMSFSFSIPHFFTLKTLAVPAGFVILTSFCLGMVFLPFLQLIPKIFRTAEIRAKEKKIRELEKELEESRLNPSTPDSETSFPS